MTRILIVDDEEQMRRLLQQMLAVNGYDCVLADNAAMARRYLGGKPFDLVISDLNMPGESGLDLLRHVVHEHPRAATMLITGSHDPGITQKARQLGVYRCMRKPFQFKELLAVVAAALEARTANGCSRSGAQAATGTLRGALASVKSCAYRRPVPKLTGSRWPFWNTRLFGSGSN